jgi:hypothetical protein
MSNTAGIPNFWDDDWSSMPESERSLFAFDPAWAAFVHRCRVRSYGITPSGSGIENISLQQLSDLLRVLEERHKARDKLALTGALILCAKHSLPLPMWASEGILQVLELAAPTIKVEQDKPPTVAKRKPVSLNQALGLDAYVPTGNKWRKAIQRKEWSLKLYVAAEQYVASVNATSEPKAEPSVSEILRFVLPRMYEQGFPYKERSARTMLEVVRAEQTPLRQALKGRRKIKID